MKRSKVLLISIISLLAVAVVYELSLKSRQIEVEKKTQDSLITAKQEQDAKIALEQVQDSLALVEKNRPTEEEVRNKILSNLAKEVSPFIGYNEFNIFSSEGVGLISFNLDGEFYKFDLEGVNFYYKNGVFTILCKNNNNNLIRKPTVTGDKSNEIVEKENYYTGCVSTTMSGNMVGVMFPIQTRSDKTAERIVEGINEYYHLLGYTDNLELKELPSRYNLLSND